LLPLARSTQVQKLATSCIIAAKRLIRPQQIERDPTFTQFGLDLLDRPVPAQWAKWITDNVNKVDPYEEQLVDEILSTLESGIASETPRESRGDQGA
jgi:hypothetical protein